MACDICGKGGVYLEPLREEYQTEEIKDLCPECLRVVDNHRDKVVKMQRKMTQSLVKRFMGVLRGEQN